MADLPRRLGALLGDDVERGLANVRADLRATKIAYTPGDSTNWASPAPTTVQQALDRIADLVVTLNGNVAIP